MRISFYSTEPKDSIELFKIVKDFDLVSRLNPSRLVYLDDIFIFDNQRYEDGSRYELNIFKADFKRCYKEMSKVDRNNITNGKIQIIALDLKFDMDFDFRLLANDFVNYWNKDTDIEFIKPKVNVFSSFDCAFYAFRSLATSYFAKALSLIKSFDILCFKKGRKIILAYNINDEETIANLNDILDHFLNAIYEMVKVTSGRLAYDIPPEVTEEVNLKDWYQTRMWNRKKKIKKRYYVKKY